MPATVPARRLLVPIAAIVGLTAVVALAAGLASSGYFAAPPPEANPDTVVRFPLPVPDDFLRMAARPSSMSLSSDGMRLAFMVTTSTNRLGLFVRDLSSITPRELQLPQGNLAWPAWSPHGRYRCTSIARSAAALTRPRQFSPAQAG